MKVYKLNYQHHKDIVDDNVLTMFVTADNQEEVEAFAKNYITRLNIYLH